jgi:hypothetical protein
MVMTAKLPAMLERIRRCRFCGREVASSALSFEENPYCSSCLSERGAKALEAGAYVAWEVSGNYLKLIDLSQRKPQ